MDIAGQFMYKVNNNFPFARRFSVGLIDVLTPLGSLGEAGVPGRGWRTRRHPTTPWDTLGTTFAAYRHLDQTALVLLIDGGGRYRDTAGTDLRLRPGDASQRDLLTSTGRNATTVQPLGRKLLDLRGSSR